MLKLLFHICAKILFPQIRDEENVHFALQTENMLFIYISCSKGIYWITRYALILIEYYVSFHITACDPRNARRYKQAPENQSFFIPWV